MIVDLRKHDKAMVLAALYNLSVPSLDKEKMDKYVPGGMSVGEAIVMLDEHGDKYSWIRGRPLFIDLAGEEVDLGNYIAHQPIFRGRDETEHFFTTSRQHIYCSWLGHLSGIIAVGLFASLRSVNRPWSEVRGLFSDTWGHGRGGVSKMRRAVREYYENLPLQVDLHLTEQLFRCAAATHRVLMQCSPNDGKALSKMLNDAKVSASDKPKEPDLSDNDIAELKDVLRLLSQSGGQ